MLSLLYMRHINAAACTFASACGVTCSDDALLLLATWHRLVYSTLLPFMCRLSGYDSVVQQSVQASNEGNRVPNVHGTCAPGELQLPAGYTSEPTATAAARVKHIRSTWTEEEDVKPEEHNELKWTADELLARAQKVQRRREELEAAAQLEQLPPAERGEAYKRLQRRLKELYREFGGIRGLPSFSKLSYFRCVEQQDY